MTHVTELIILAISTILTAVLIITAQYQKDLGESLIQTTNSSIAEANVSLSTSNLQKYNGVTVTGADVKNAINRYAKDGLSVIVKFTQDVDGDGEADENYTEAVWKKNDGVIRYTYGDDTYEGFAAMGESCYLNPAADFTGLVAEDNNLGYVNSMVFTQVGLTGIPTGNSGGSGGGGSGSGSGGSNSSGGTLMGEDDLITLNQTLGELISSMEDLIGALSNTSAGSGGNTGGTSGAGSSDSIATTLNTISNRLTAIESSIEGINDTTVDLSGVTNGIATLQTSIAALQTSVNSINGYALSEDVANVKKDVANLATQVSSVNVALSGKLDSISNTLGTAEADANADDDTVMERLKRLEEGQAAMQTDLNRIIELLDVINANTGGN